MGVCEMTVKCTILCYWIARPVKPGVQSSNTSRVCFTVISHTPMRPHLNTHILSINRIEMTFVCSIWYTLRYIFFTFTICFIALTNLGWRCGRQCCCYHCDCMQQHYDVMQFEYVLWRHTKHEWAMNIHYKTWIAYGWFTNIILTPSKHKHNPHPLETMGRV